jgi:chromosome segregation ATPase
LLKTERVTELESSTKDAERQLQEQEQEANNVISQWQETCSELEEKCSSIEEELEQASGNEKLVAHLRETEEELRQAHHTIARDEKVVQQWEGK